MSLYSLRGLGAKFYRHAFILAHRAYVRPPKLSFSPANAVYIRKAHNGLYDMKEFAAVANMCHNTKVLGASGCEPAANSPCKTRSSPPGCGDAKPVKGPRKETKATSSCSDGGSGKDSGGGSCDDDKKGSGLNKALLALAALLGLGGLWLLMRSGKGGGDTKKNDAKGDCQDEELIPPKPTIPSTSSDLPKQVQYLLIGGGTAAFSAFRSIKTNDPHGKILMITNEYRKPYMRPPLSKELWYSAKNGEVTPPDFRFKTWTGSERSIYFEPEQFFVEPSKLNDNPNGGIAVAHGFTVKKIDPLKHKVTLNDGYQICYEQCLIATGCSPKNLPVFQSASPSVKEKVMVFRSPDDFERLKGYADQRKTIMIVGNGFMGSELACSLATYVNNDKCKGAKIYQVFQESGNMSRVLPDYLSKWTTRKVEAQGVCVIPNASVRSAQRDEQLLKVTLNNGNTLLVDVVVVCVGCDPNTSLAYPSGLEVHPSLGGFMVNAELEARRDLFVAGDASCFYDPLLGRRRVEHHDHSVISGKLAGENMVGMKKPYKHQSMFWSDLGPEIGYEAIGLVDSALPTVGIFALAPKVERPTNSDNLTEKREQSTPPATDVNPEKCENTSSIATAETTSTATTATATKTSSTESTATATAVTTPTPKQICNDMNDDSFGKGVIFYLKNGKVVGILLWNLFNRTGLARTIINQDKKYEDLNEVAKLFEIHS